MALLPLIEYEAAPEAVRAVYDDIRATRKTDYVNNFWKALAHDPALLARTWANVKATMGPGALDPLVKELVYIAVSVTNNCEYCIHSHTAAGARQGHDAGDVRRADGRRLARQRHQPAGKRLPDRRRRAVRVTARPVIRGDGAWRRWPGSATGSPAPTSRGAFA
jgi:AhpD family alkylhydroperoxidase